MDRKAWIIVIACCGLLGLNFYFNSQKPKEAPAAPATVAQSEALGNAVGTPSSAGSEGDLIHQKPVATSPVAQPQTWSLTAKKNVDGKNVDAAVFTFTNIGGGIRNIEIADKIVDSRDVPDKRTRINEAQAHGIGNLLFGVTATADPIFDVTVYKRVDDAKDSSKIVLLGLTPQGLAVMKEYSLDPLKDAEGKPLIGSSYMVKLKMTIQNTTSNRVSTNDLAVFAGAAYPKAKSESADIYTHFFYLANNSLTQETPSYFEKGMFSSAKQRVVVAPENLTWAGVMNQYYATILIPSQESRGPSVYATRNKFRLAYQDNFEVPGVELAMLTPSIDLAPQAIRELNYEIYAGPKHNQVLSDLPYKLDEVMAYGWLTVLSAPMNWLLNFFYGWFANWGWAIVAMTLVVRGLIWPLHKKSFMSMKRMSQVQPMMAELKEKYGNDKQKLNMEMMKLYQQYGINPASGCLPMLIQIPIFFAFYRVLQYAAELEGQPWIFWVKDLSLPDTVATIPVAGYDLPINILPILMAVTMVLQMKLTPKAGDKMQQRIMTFMPIMFFFFCYTFASALALYWTTQNIISIIQSYLIRKLPAPELVKKPKKKAGFFGRMMEAQRQALEEQQRKAKGHNQHGTGAREMRNVSKKK